MSIYDVMRSTKRKVLNLPWQNQEFHGLDRQLLDINSLLLQLSSIGYRLALGLAFVRH